MKLYSEREVRDRLLVAVHEAGGQRAAGTLWGISGQHVGRVMAGEKLSPAILKALGFEVAKVETSYRRRK